MIRKIIKIEAEKCNGCGLCVSACHEDAIGIIDGKAVLLRDDYCDGLGDCLPVCPTNALSFETREALEYNEVEVKRNMQKKKEATSTHSCPGSAVQAFTNKIDTAPASTTTASHLNQWPVQIKLVPVNAPYFKDAQLLIAADCSAYAHSNFHEKFMKEKITIIGCPKLDEGDYTEKLTAILNQNSIKSITVVRMEVPCCGGIENAVMRTLQNCKKTIALQVVTLSIQGDILNSED